MQFQIRKKPITPLIVTIPHSGSFYPKEFLKNKSIDINKLTIMEDYKTNLFIKDVNLQLTDVFIAKCSRTVVDLNRSRESLDISMFKSKIEMSPNDEILLIKSGLGVLPSKCYNEKIFQSKLPNKYISNMLKKFYDPFHLQLKERINYLKSIFGVVYLIDIHSTPPISNNISNFPDVIIGNNFGKSCDETFKNYLVSHFQNFNLNHTLNSPYSGGYITRTYGKKDNNVHAIQVEISKDFYMNQSTLKLNGNLKILKSIFKNIVKDFSFIKLKKIAAE